MRAEQAVGGEGFKMLVMIGSAADGLAVDTVSTGAGTDATAVTTTQTAIPSM